MLQVIVDDGVTKRFSTQGKKAERGGGEVFRSLFFRRGGGVEFLDQDADASKFRVR
jgi:hypothetical protein